MMLAMRFDIPFSVLVAMWSVSVARADDVPSPNPPCPAPLELTDCTPTLDCGVKTEDTRACPVACLMYNPFTGECYLRGNDTCDIGKSPQNLAYIQSKSACEANKAAQKAQCESANAEIAGLNARRAAACKADAPSSNVPSAPH